MNTEIKFIDIVNKDKEGNAVELTDYTLTGILFLPRIGENVYFSGNSTHFLVKEIQHCFKKESEYETKQTIYVQLTTTKNK